MRAIWLLCAVAVIITQGGNSAPAETASTTPESTETTTNSPSPLDLLYEAADDDLNAISFEKPPLSLQDDVKSGDRNTDRPLTQSPFSDETSPTEPANAQAGEVTHTEEASTTEIATEQSSLASSTSTPPSVSSPASTVFSPSSTEAPNSPKSTSTETSTTLSSRIFPTTVRHRSTRRPQRPLHIDDESEEEESDTGVVDIKKKPTAGPTRRRRPVKPAVWDAEDDRIEKDIITKIFHGAMRNHERMRNRNLRRLLRRFQVLAFRSDLSADEFHKFMKLVSEYTPSRMPTFLLRKSERRQFQEANRVRWQHIREQMLQQAEESRTEVVQTFLRMVERDGALHRRFGKPRRSQMTLEDFLRRQAPLMRRLLLPPHIEEHPLVRELLGGRMPPSPFFGGCCDF